MCWKNERFGGKNVAFDDCFSCFADPVLPVLARGNQTLRVVRMLVGRWLWPTCLPSRLGPGAALAGGGVSLCCVGPWSGPVLFVVMGPVATGSPVAGWAHVLKPVATGVRGLGRIVSAVVEIGTVRYIGLGRLRSVTAFRARRWSGWLRLTSPARARASKCSPGSRYRGIGAPPLR